MFKHIAINNDVSWVGVLDYDIEVFDIIMKTDYGTSYNSYLVKGSEKTALFETVKVTFFDEFLERLSNISSPKDIDYVVVNHTEPDHSGSIAKLLELNPDITVVGSAAALKYLKEIVNGDFNSMQVKGGETLALGNKTIEFISVPNLHWPDSMYSFIQEDSLLITCDSFGAHYCSKELFNDLITEDYMPAYKYYYDCIFAPFKPFVLKALEKVEALDLKAILPGHGPVIRENISDYINLYKEWSSDNQLEDYVVIPYVSAYGYTKIMAEEIKKGLESQDITVYIYDLVEADKQEVIEKMHKAKGILFGSCTILSDTLPPIWELLAELNPIIHKGKFAGAFGSYGWSGEAVINITARLKQLKFKMPVEGLRTKFNPSEDALKECFDFGKQFGKAIK